VDELCSTPINNATFEELRVEDDFDGAKHFVGTDTMYCLESWISAIAHFALKIDVRFLDNHIMRPRVVEKCTVLASTRMIEFAHERDALIRKIVGGSSQFNLGAGQWDLVGNEEICRTPTHTLWELVCEWQQHGVVDVRLARPLLDAWPDVLAPRRLQELTKAVSDPKVVEQLSIAQAVFLRCERDLATALWAVSMLILFCSVMPPMRINRLDLRKDRFWRALPPLSAPILPLSTDKGLLMLSPSGSGSVRSTIADQLQPRAQASFLRSGNSSSCVSASRGGGLCEGPQGLTPGWEPTDAEIDAARAAGFSLPRP
jgi:hypothetical protein